MNTALEVLQETNDQTIVELPEEPVGPDLTIGLPPPLLSTTEAALDTVTDRLTAADRAIVDMEAGNGVIAALHQLPNYGEGVAHSWKEWIAS